MKAVRATDLWALGLPVTVVAVLCALLLSKIAILLFGHPPDFSEVLSTFQGTLSPKPHQQLRYLFILIFWPIFLATGVVLLNRWRKVTAGHRRAEVLRRMVRTSQVTLLVFFLFNVAYQEAFIHAYFATKSPVMAYSVLAFIAALFVVFRSSKWRISEPVALGIALGVSVLQLLVCIITDGNYLGSPLGLASHLPFTFDEFAAVANGRTLSVNYFPQYQQLLPYLFSPLFHFFGLSITTYTGGLAALSAAILFFVYSILTRVSERPMITLLLFLSWLGIAFFPIETNGDARYLTFTYFPIGPFRLLGFWSVAYFTIRTVTGDFTFRKQLLCFFWASLVTFNTFDFGVPGLVGCLAVMILFSKNWKRTGLAFFSGFLVSIVVSVAIPLIRSGKFPDLSVALTYLSAAGRVGYTSLSTPTWGNHWIFLLALLSCLAIGVTRWWNDRIHPTTDIRARSLTAAYVFFGLAGSGAFSYFMNRSHWHVLAVIAPIAFFPFLLFAANSARMSRMPRILCFIIVACGLALLKNTPNPIAQWERISLEDSTFSALQSDYISRVMSNAGVGEKVAICYPFGQLIAKEAGVVNVFPYPQSISMLLRSQLDLATRILEENQVQALFGEFPSEFFPWMEKHGFHEVDRLGTFAVYRRSDLTTR